MAGMTAIPLATIVATILSVEAHHARIDAGLVEGIRPDDNAVVFYKTTVGAEKKRVFVSRGVVIEVEDHGAVLELESEFTVLPGYSVEFEVPMARIAPLSVLELARSRLISNRSSESLRSIIDVLVPEDEFLEQEVVRLIQERQRRRGLDEYTTRPTLLDEPPADPTLAAASELAHLARDWAQAWGDQRVDDYLAFYSRGFLAPGGNRAAWEDLRRRRITRPKFIKLTLQFKESAYIDAGRAWIEFRQSYWSDTFSDTVTKRLEVIREDDTWKILQESVSP